MLPKKEVQKSFIEKIAFSNKYNIIRTYFALFTTKILTAQLTIFRLHREPLQCPFDSSNCFLTYLESLD